MVHEGIALLRGGGRSKNLGGKIVILISIVSFCVFPFSIPEKSGESMAPLVLHFRHPWYSMSNSFCCKCAKYSKCYITQSASIFYALLSTFLKHNAHNNGMKMIFERALNHGNIGYGVRYKVR